MQGCVGPHHGHTGGGDGDQSGGAVGGQGHLGQFG